MPRGLDFDTTGTIRRLGSGERTGGAQGRGQEGDIVLQSADGVRFVLSDLDHREGFHPTGGNLIDITGRTGDDSFGGLSPWLDATFPRQPKWERLEVLDGAVRVEGVDSGDPRVRLRTWWVLADPDSFGTQGRLHIRTEVELLAGAPVHDYELGDLVAWGRLGAFAPGPGTALADWKGPLPWVGAQGPGLAVLLVGEGPLTGPHGSSWSDPIWTTVDLEVGRPVTYSRDLYVGRTLAELVEVFWTRRGIRAAPAAGTVRDPRGLTVAGVDLLVEQQQGGVFRPLVSGRTDSIGLFRPALPAGTFRVVGRSPSRRVLAEHTFEHDPDRGAAFWSLPLSYQGRIELSARGPDQKPIPARFRFFPLDGTPPLDLGPASAAVGGDRMYALGPTVLRLPPGRYEVVATRGPQWSIGRKVVDVSENGEPVAVSFDLRPTLSAASWTSCDLHVHSELSADSAVPRRDALLATLGEGLQCFASTDHDTTADWRPDLAALGNTHPLLWIPGIEVTAEPQGHWNALPWAPELGAFDHAGLPPDALVSGLRTRSPTSLLQVNHPLWKGNGLLAYLGLDEGTGLPRTRRDDGSPSGATTDWDLYELVNGKHLDEVPASLAFWERLSATGRRSALTGNSDSHRLVGQERGVPRTYVATSRPELHPVLDALRARRTVASTGPTLSEIERPAAGTFGVQAEFPAWMDDVRFELRAIRGGKVEPLPHRLPFGSCGTAQDGLTRLCIAEAELGLPKPEVVVVIARGERPMEPWMDVPPFAVRAFELDQPGLR